MFSGQRPAEVLIADDEPIARDILHFYLESLGCRVHAAEDGNEALALFRDGADWIGLVILDARPDAGAVVSAAPPDQSVRAHPVLLRDLNSQTRSQWT